ncbi:hypothetical protein AVEN_274108-1 [Araneus ventricosus]|uniref:Mutator-like transposase domain-containing protein n=1 Tax=Araneus ventricosus TaxID=182803 RepID=A0A4Y2A917_ARAVE|nr:hypothetical protein AVEN_274108-1 [Araneus ventricosus]
MKFKPATSEVATESMKTSANNTMLLKGAQKDTTGCDVSMDGTWQKRGYSSLNGCVSCISVEKGNILDIEIICIFFRMCNNMANSKYHSKHVWQNHKGPSSSTEKVGAHRIFERSEMTRNLQYTQYYGDGDSKAYDAVKYIYGGNTVNKLECNGHVQKRVGSRLRKLKISRKDWEERGN